MERKTELEKFLDIYKKKIEQLAEENLALSSKITTNSSTIEYFTLAKYIRENSIGKIKKMDLNELSKTFLEESNGISSINPMKIIFKFLEPINDAIVFINNYYKVLESKLPEELSSDIKELLKKIEIDTEVLPELREELINCIIKQYHKFSRQVDITGNEHIKSLYTALKWQSLHTLIILAKEDPLSKEDYRRIGIESGIYSDKILMESPELLLTPSDLIDLDSLAIHNLIDVEKLLDSFENETLDEKKEEYIFQENYFTRLIKYIKGNNQDKINLYLNKIISKDITKNIINLYRTQKIDYNDFLVCITSPIITNLDKNFKKNIKKDIKSIINSKEAINTFSNSDIFELAKLGFVSDIDLINVYKTQSFSNTYKSTEFIILDEDIKCYFNVQRLLSNYFKPKNNNLEEILSFYHEFILQNLNTEDLKRFETEILEYEGLINKDIVTLFSKGFISISTMRELKENNQEVKSMLYEMISSLKFNFSNKKKDVENKDFIFFLIYDGLINERELVSILGIELVEHLIEERLQKDIIKLEPENIDSISNLGFLRNYELPQIEIDDEEISVSPDKLLELYCAGFISNKKMKSLKNEKINIKEALYNFIKKQFSHDIKSIFYLIQNDIVDEFELIDILGDNNFEKIIKIRIRKANNKTRRNF